MSGAQVQTMRLINKRIFILFILALQVSCAKAPFAWIESIPIVEQKTPLYRIQPGDQLDVAVWDQPRISGTYVVREDGFVTIPLIGDVTVSDSTLKDAAAVIKALLEKGGIIQDLWVTVISRVTTPKYVSVIGEVAQPGQVVLKPKDTIVDVLAMAGGLTEFADKDSIYVLRQKADPPRVRFDYDRLTSCPTCGIHFKLQGGDVIIVE